MPSSLGIYAGGALLASILGLLVVVWWQGRKAGLAVTEKTEATHAKEALAIDESVSRLSDADVDSKLFGKR